MRGWAGIGLTDAAPPANMPSSSLSICSDHRCCVCVLSLFPAVVLSGIKRTVGCLWGRGGGVTWIHMMQTLYAVLDLPSSSLIASMSSSFSLDSSFLISSRMSCFNLS